MFGVSKILILKGVKNLEFLNQQFSIVKNGLKVKVKTWCVYFRLSNELHDLKYHMA